MVDLRDIACGALGALGSLLYPEHCGACGVRLGEKKTGDGLICEGCRSLIVPMPQHCCPLCSDPLALFPHCPNCEGRQWHLSAIVSGCRYKGVVRDLIQRFKYGRDQSLLPLLGAILLPALEDSRIAGRKFDAVVPVPLHPSREREREFNQAMLLALPVARHLGIPVIPMLARIRRTAPQAGFDRRGRMENLEGAFVLRSKRSFPEAASLLLVDDVTTTGATLDACAAVLLEEGATDVFAVTVARG